MPSSLRSRPSVFGPSPGSDASSTNSGGYFARSSSSFARRPAWKNSRIFFAVLAPMPSIAVSSFSDSPASSPGWEAIASIARS